VQSGLEVPLNWPHDGKLRGNRFGLNHCRNYCHSEARRYRARNPLFCPKADSSPINLAMHDSLRRIDFHLRKWARRKFKRFKQKPKSAREWFARIVKINPALFAHWPLLYANSRIPGAG
jgi:hypothetical protein